MTFKQIANSIKRDPRELHIVRLFGDDLTTGYLKCRLQETWDTASNYNLAERCIVASLILCGEKLNKRNFAKMCNDLTLRKPEIFNTPALCKQRAYEYLTTNDFFKAAAMLLQAEYHEAR